MTKIKSTGFAGSSRVKLSYHLRSRDCHHAVLPAVAWFGACPNRLFLSTAQQAPDEARRLAHVVGGNDFLELFPGERFHVGPEYRVRCRTLDSERDWRAADGRQQPGGMGGGTHFEIEDMGGAG